MFIRIFATMRTISEIQFSALPGFSPLFLDYVNGVPGLDTLYDFRPDQKGYEYAIRKVQAGSYNRTELAAVIEAQYSKTPEICPSDLLERLKQNSSCTVTTGHQLCLLGGPAYFVYKIATVIQLAAKLSKMYSANVVPVYWMATEDHDVEEISSVVLFGKKITWNTEQTGPAGRLSTNDLGVFIEEICNTLGGSPKAIEISAALRRIYAAGKTLADATREFVHWLFGDKIFVLDPDNAELKKAMSTVFSDELKYSSSEKHVQSTIQFLSTKGYDIQVKPRNINLFYLEGNRRKRIERGDSGLQLVDDGATISKSVDFEEEVKSAPENFSPNVVLRPVYQQMILPNIAYVGGPGELVYWLEYKQLFDACNVTFPILQPRFFAMQLSAKDAEWLVKNNVNIQELAGDFDELLKVKLASRAGEELSLENEKEILNLLRSTIAEKAALADATLRAFADAEMKKAEDALKVVEVRMMRALKQRDEVFSGQLKKLRERIFPNGTLQERTENFLSLSISTGVELTALLDSELFPVNGVRVLTTAPAE